MVGLIILLCILGIVLLFVFIVLAVLLAPLKVSGECLWSDAAKDGEIDISWFHPRICHARVDFGNALLTWNLLWLSGRQSWGEEEGRRKADERQEEGRPKAEEKAQEKAQEKAEEKAGEKQEEWREVYKSQERVREESEQHRSPEPGPAAEGKTGKAREAAAKVGGESSAKVGEEAAGKAKAGKPKTGESKAASPAGGVFAALRTMRQVYSIVSAHHLQRKLLKWAGRSLRWTLRIIRFKHLHVEAKVGLEDPAATGILYGRYMALRSFLQASRKRNIAIFFEPRFDRQMVDINAGIRLKTSLGRMMMPGFIALATAPYLSIWRVWRGVKKVTSTRSDKVKTKK